MKSLVVASHNAKKVIELETLLKPLSIQLISAQKANLPDVEETELTFKGNARLKVESAFNQTEKPCIADDSGFCVDALNGAPGIYSARYKGGYNRVLHEIKTKQGQERSAYFICIIAYKNNKDDIHYFEGKVKGSIPEQAQGKGGFGYDPIFIAEGQTATFATITPSQKNKLSARSIALRKFIDYIKDEINL